MTRRAVFFDKDGVINIDKGISGNFEPLDFIVGACDLIALFKKIGFMIFVVTNQPVVARGLMNEDELKSYFEKFSECILKNNSEAIIDKIYYCPHHPDANVEEYRIACECRKPKSGMIMRAVEEFKLDIKSSFMIGDRMSDVIAGCIAGCKTVHLLSGRHLEKAIVTDLKLDAEIAPDYIINELSELRSIIV